MTPAPEIVPIGPQAEAALRTLFREIAGDKSRAWFSPHPFDDETAERIARRTGKDLYVAARAGDRLVAYGMLRGWDEGYEIPSLGIFLCRCVRGSGLAERLMRHLHETARQRGSPAVRLRVHDGNARARRLYEKLGYVFQTREAGLLVGVLSLPGANDRGTDTAG